MTDAALDHLTQAHGRLSSLIANMREHFGQYPHLAEPMYQLADYLQTVDADVLDAIYALRPEQTPAEGTQ